MHAFGQRAEGECGQVGQRHDDQGDADEHADEQGLVGLERAGGLGYRLLASQRTGGGNDLTQFLFSRLR